MTFRKKSDKDIPSENEARAALTLLKREAQKVLARWSEADRMAESGRVLIGMANDEVGSMKDVSIQDLHATYREIIRITGDPLPGPKLVAKVLGSANGRLPIYWFLPISKLQEGLYPSVEDLACFACLIMARTGWNPSTVLSINISNDDWAVRVGDPTSDLWRLVAWKERAKAWQDTLCRGRHTTGPYFLIKSLLERTHALRKLALSCPDRFVSTKDIAQRTPFLAAAQKNKMGSVVAFLPSGQDGACSKWWREIRSDHNDAVSRLLARDMRPDDGNGKCVAGVAAHSASFVKIPESMVPSDWRDLYANFVFVDSRYSWLMVQWALGHKRLSSTRHYLRSRLWKRFSEARLGEVQGLLFEQLEGGEILYSVMRARLDFGHVASTDDLKRLRAYREKRRARNLTPSGYDCQAPFNPPKEMDPGNPSDGSVRARCGDRCPGCPVGFAFDPTAMARRLVRLRLIRKSISVAAWHESQFAADIDCLERDLKQWPEDDVKALVERWERAYEAGEEQLNPWAGLN
jgi:hypothetical protein